MSSKTKQDNEIDNVWKKSSVQRHDLFNFESKIDYTLEPTRKKKTSYLLSAYFFIPNSLQINKDSYTKEQFFSDLNNYIRFKTPKMSIESIINKENVLSPITTILKGLKDIEYGKSSRELLTKIQRELCLLANIIKVYLRDQFRYIHNIHINFKSQYNIPKMISSYLKSIKKLQDQLVHIEEKFLKSQIPLKLQETFHFVDEYISFQIEIWVTRFLEIFRVSINQEIKNIMITIIEKEQKQREKSMSPLIILENNDNEAFAYQEGIMKKYVQRVLYLEKKKKDPKSSSIEIFYSVAAGIAMFFSLFFGFLILTFFTIYSVPFIIATVVIYMLKDRIKENIRGVSQKAIGSIFPDQRINIVDGFNKEKIGKSKEIVNFMKKDKIPPEILKIRRSSNISTIEEKGKPEEVILYKKKIILFNKKIREFHRRRKDISDVIRFNIRRFLRYADDPIQILTKWNVNKKKIENVSISKVYHLNLILKLTSFKEEGISNIYYRKFRIVIDQKGIKRVLEPEFHI
ncbi:MAG: hypothetical protein ACFFHD_16495 [Promethearchaeota archaeon]